MTAFQDYFNQFTIRYADLLAKQDSKALHKLLLEPVPVFQSGDSRLAAALHQQKARAYALFGENNEMDRQFEAASKLLMPKEQWMLFVDWANLYILQLRIASDSEQVNQLFDKAYAIMQRVDLSRIKKDRYGQWAVVSLLAFCAHGSKKAKSYPQLYNTLNYTVLPVQLLNNPQENKVFFAHFFKSIVLAIEFRDSAFLLKLLKMISVDDALMYGTGTLFAKFQQTINDTMDLRPEFAADFNLIYDLAPKLSTQFPNLHLFMGYLEKQNITAINYLFKAM